MSTSFLIARWADRWEWHATIRNELPDGSEMGPLLFASVLADKQADMLQSLEWFCDGYNDGRPPKLADIVWTVEPDRFGQVAAPPPAEPWEAMVRAFVPRPAPTKVHSPIVVEVGYGELVALACRCGAWRTDLMEGDTLVSLGDEFAGHVQAMFHQRIADSMARHAGLLERLADA